MPIRWDRHNDKDPSHTLYRLDPLLSIRNKRRQAGNNERQTAQRAMDGWVGGGTKCISPVIKLNWVY